MYWLLPDCSHCIIGAMFIYSVSVPSIKSLATDSTCKTCNEADRCCLSLHCSVAHVTAPSWVRLVAPLRSTSHKMFHSYSASLPGPHCDAPCGVAHILLFCKGTQCVCSSIKDCMSAEDARWNGTARGHQCAPHGRPLNRQVPVPQVCSQDCKPLALCSLCTCGQFCLLAHASGRTLCMRIWSCASVGNMDKSKSSLS